MSQQRDFVSSMTITPTGEFAVTRVAPEVGKVFDFPGQKVGVRSNVVGALEELVCGFYRGSPELRALVGKTLSQRLERDITKPEFVISLPGEGALQFFANLAGNEIDLAANCGLKGIGDLSVDKVLPGLYVGGNAINGNAPTMVEVDCTKGKPKPGRSFKVAESGNIEWSAAHDGVLVVALDDGTVKVLLPGKKKFGSLPSEYQGLRAQKVFSGHGGRFFLRQSDGKVSDFDADRDGVSFSKRPQELDANEELLCVTQGAGDKDLFVTTTGQTFAFFPA